MKKFLLSQVGVLFLFFIFANKVFATDVVINEVFPDPSGSSSETTEFIELYNKSSNPVSITGWKISDTTGSTDTYTIPDNTLPPGGFVAFRKEVTSIALNNTGDGVILKNVADETQDSMTYDSTIEDKSWGRIPDGTGSFVNNSDPTEGSQNSVPPTSTPTNTPTPTKTPTPTNSPTPTKTPTPSPLKTPTPTQKVNPTPTDNPNSNLKLASKTNNDIFNNDSTSTPTQTPKPEVLGATTTAAPWIFIGLGLIFITACGILAYFQFGDKIFLWKKKNL